MYSKYLYSNQLKKLPTTNVGHKLSWPVHQCDWALFVQSHSESFQ